MLNYLSMKKWFLIVFLVIFFGAIGYVAKNVLMQPEAVVEQTDVVDELSQIVPSPALVPEEDYTEVSVGADQEVQNIEEPAEPEQKTKQPADSQKTETDVEKEQTTPAPTPVVEKMLSGVFFGRDGEEASGRAVVYQVDGKSVLRFEDFSVTPGPDLFVYLSPKDVATSGDLGEFLNLGVLKSPTGDQTYVLPDQYKGYPYVVIWCRAFSHLFGVARLQ